MAQRPRRLTHGSLFTGIGGFDLGFERAGIKTLWQVEIDPYCRAVLAKHFPKSQRYSDIRSIHGVLAHATQQQSHVRNARESASEKTQTQFRGFCASCLASVDIITGGFPCQPFSVAGKRRGTADDRWLWPEMRRVIEEVRPRWVVAENVPGIIKLALDQVLSDLEALGYTVGAVTLPACAVDAPHRRDRLWIVGYAEHARQSATKISQGDSQGSNSSTTRKEQASESPRPSQQSTDVADASESERGWCPRSRRWKRQHEETQSHGGGRGRQENGLWFPEPHVGRVAHGSSFVVDIHRLMCYIRRYGQADQVAIAKASTESHPPNKMRLVRVACEVATSSLSWTPSMVNSHDSLPIVPHKGRVSAQSLGARTQETEAMYRLQKALLAQPRQGEKLWGEVPFNLGEAQRFLAMANRVNRLKALGNAVVPQLAEAIAWMIWRAEGMRLVANP